MLKPLTQPAGVTRLADLGVVRVHGPDAVKFLQGQVSNDVTRLSASESVFAGLHNAQGRAIALLRFVLAGPDEVLGILPRELAPVVAARLAKFVLRAKAKVSDASLEWEVAGVAGPRVEGVIGASVGDSLERWLQVTPVASNAISESLPREIWHALDIAAGIPQVFAATSEAFVAQMLNLDVLDGIAFDKGCYTGQEVIARAHYRGKVKRRLQRFRTLSSETLKPGDGGTLQDGRTFKVVDAVHSEFLAVTSMHGASEDAEAPVSESVLNAEQLPLPYALPA